jgi:hypothetical protein
VRLLSMQLQLVRFTVHGHALRIIVRLRAGSGAVTVTAHRSGRRRRSLSRSVHARSGRLTVVLQLSPGRWTINISGRPSTGYAAARVTQRVVDVAALGVSHVVAPRPRTSAAFDIRAFALMFTGAASGRTTEGNLLDLWRL